MGRWNLIRTYIVTTMAMSTAGRATPAVRMDAITDIYKRKYLQLTIFILKRGKAEKGRTIRILHFADMKDIRPIYFDKTYHTVFRISESYAVLPLAR